MHKPILAGLLMASLAACTPTREDLDKLDVVEDVTCATRPGNCAYLNSPVHIDESRKVELPKRPYAFFPLSESLSFTDAQRKEWLAPSGTLTDGASIPPIFVTIVGTPTAPEYVNAGALHDAYCGIGNEGGANYHNGRWQDVHTMFYDALVASGTPDTRAKIMFAAVWLGGPRWNVYDDMQKVPTPRLQQAMRKAKSYIESRDPTLSQLKHWLQLEEGRMMRENPGRFPQFDYDSPREVFDFEPEEPEPEEPNYPEEVFL